ncbi:hypothetical protein CP523_11370 [Clostridium septicum]|uniref:Uncharacterized protein n=1 Tax=Clostridium septicum TaxID=1504 RepID=A0A9N7JLI6_CLOSE|nr:hypothetical protein CP523_11370 [Clostridium septicum]
MKVIRKELAKLYRFFYSIFWGFYFSASYLFCKNKYKSFLMSIDI